MNREDRIGLTGLGETHGGARLIFRIQGALAFEVILPGTFPT